MAEMEGKTLGQYELRRQIGKGGMANVYEAFDRESGQTLALKIFKREDEELLRRFLREAQVMSSLHGHHLVPVIGSGTASLDNSLHYYIAMPYMRGGTLRARIRRGPLALDETCRAIAHIADALDYVHSQGIVHRDIKASNVLIDDQENYYLTDFGIARLTDDMTHLTTTGNVLGTVDYVAPELFEVDRKADALSDLYSLGVLLYEMVTGRLPFIAENQIALVTMHLRNRPPAPRSIDASIPDQVERVLLKGLEKKPERRYRSAALMAEDFCRAASIEASAVLAEALRTSVQEQSPPLYKPGQLILSPLPIADPAVTSHDRPLPAVAPDPLGSQFDDHFRNSNRKTQQARPFYRRTWFALVVLLLALTIIAGSISALLLPPHPGTGTVANGTTPVSTAGSSIKARKSPTTPNLTATALTIQNATATARAQATATAIARATATAQAQASATAGVIATATSGQPVYQDALNNANSQGTVAAGWDQSDNCVFKSDGYHDNTTSSLQGCKEANNTYTSVAVTVDMSIISGQSGGIFFRMSAPVLDFGGYSGYLFEVDSAGHYRVLSSNNFNSGSPNVLQPWTASSTLHQGSAVNTLQVIMRGSNFSLYANGVFLTSLTDGTYSSGQIAFLARSDGTTTADVVYSKLIVYRLG